MRTLYQITAELYQEHVVPIINGKQYDTGRSVLITLTDAGAVVVPESGDMLRLYCRKPDGTVSYLPGTLSGTAVEVALTNQLQALPGVVECELQIGTGAEMVSTPVFRLNVLPSNYDAAAIESSDEFGALETALQTVQQYDTRIAALEDVADGLGDASTYGVANDLTQQTAGENVLDAAQGKALGDSLTTAEGDITALQSQAAALGKFVAASGKYTTAQWTYGTTTCSITIPSDGIWIVWGCFEMDNTANRNMYRQLQMQIQGSGSSWLLGVNNIYYDATGTNSNDGIVRTVCAPGNLKSGAVIRPYVHTGDTGVVFTVRLVALRVA